MAEIGEKTVPCPICRKPVPFDGPFMPFCSDRCRILDLGNWASGNYVISSPLDEDDEAAGGDEALEDES